LKPLKIFIDVTHKNVWLKKQPTKGGDVLTKRIDWNVLLKMETDNLRWISFSPDTFSTKFGFACHQIVQDIIPFVSYIKAAKVW